MKNDMIKGHISAAVTVFIWGISFISTKILLKSFLPAEILFFRFMLGLAALWIIYPRPLTVNDRRREMLFAAAGICGIALYYSLENFALTYTTASNAGVIISAAPFFTAILSRLILKTRRLSAYFFVGFVISMTGIVMISFAGGPAGLDLRGDMLALAAAAVWAVYSVIIQKISGYGYNNIQTVRRTFMYGLIFMLPILYFSGGSLDITGFYNISSLGNMFFLGLGASALCFVTWNAAVSCLGSVKTSVYIYAVPAVTVITSVTVLKEPLTVNIAVGTALTLTGLIISERKGEK